MRRGGHGRVAASHGPRNLALNEPGTPLRESLVLSFRLVRGAGAEAPTPGANVNFPRLSPEGSSRGDVLRRVRLSTPSRRNEYCALATQVARGCPSEKLALSEHSRQVEHQNPSGGCLKRPTNGNGLTRSACPRARPNGRSSGFAGGALVPFRAAAARGRRAPSYCNLHMVRAIGPPPFRGAKRVARVSDVANSDHGVRGTGHPEASVQRLLAGGSGRRTRRARAHSAATIWPGDRHAAGTREYAKWPNGQVANFVAAWHEPRRHRCDARAGVRDPARIART